MKIKDLNDLSFLCVYELEDAILLCPIFPTLSLDWTQSQSKPQGYFVDVNKLILNLYGKEKHLE